MERLADVLIDLDDHVLVEASRIGNTAAEQQETLIGEVLAYLDDMQTVLDAGTLHDLRRLVFTANAVMLALFADRQGLEIMRALFGGELLDSFCAERRSAGDPVLTGHSIRPREIDDVGSHGGSNGPAGGVALRRGERSPGAANRRWSSGRCAVRAWTRWPARRGRPPG
jgi:hypothetical protein